MRRPRFWRGGPDCARGSEDVVLLEARRALLDREGAAVVECKRLDHRESLLGQPPISEQRSDYGLSHLQGRSWVKVIELARQLFPGHRRLRTGCRPDRLAPTPAQGGALVPDPPSGAVSPQSSPRLSRSAMTRVPLALATKLSRNARSGRSRRSEAQSTPTTPRAKAR